MLKYVDVNVDSYLIPNETCLVISLCGQHNSVGIPLFIKELKRLIESHKDITCVLFEGADFKPSLITYWVNYVFKHFNFLKIGWVSMLESVPNCIVLSKMDFIILKDVLYTKDYDSKYKSFDKAWFANSLSMTNPIN